MYEHHSKGLLSWTEFFGRVLRHLFLASALLTLGLGIGVAGYHFVGGLGWIDSLLNASMILGGMGPVDPLSSPAAKLFAAGYALFSGLFFIGVASLMVAPFAHRILHTFHASNSKPKT
ncbi:MAG: hypothetical protein KGS60_03730 [Verrucomicrobia bacterium]|nr:hypothetical protein [Verrucomicrobiota bacterium]